MFLYSAYQQYTNKDIINLLKKHKEEVKEERGNRIFAVSDRSKDVLNALIEELKEKKVKIKLEEKVEKIITKTHEMLFL